MKNMAWLNKLDTLLMNIRQQILTEKVLATKGKHIFSYNVKENKYKEHLNK